MHATRDKMLEIVLACGFDRAGALPLEDARDPRITEWLSRDLHGKMAYLERHAPVREDPVTGFPTFRSVIVAALEYGDIHSGKILTPTSFRDRIGMVRSSVDGAELVLKICHGPVSFGMFR